MIFLVYKFCFDLQVLKFRHVMARLPIPGFAHAAAHLRNQSVNRICKTRQKVQSSMSTLKKLLLRLRAVTQKQNDKQYHESEDDDQDSDYDAAWEPTRKISDADLVSLALHERALRGSADSQTLSATKTGVAEGSNNRVHFIEYIDGEKVCIRIPVNGHAGAWSVADGQALRSQALILRWLKRTTKLPVPDVLGFGEDLSNSLGAPYVIMSVAEGRPLVEVWNEDSNKYPLEELRQRILKSLANALAKLRFLQFPEGGTLQLCADDKESDRMPRVGTSVDMSEREYEGDVEEDDWVSKPYKSSEERLRMALVRWWEKRQSTPTYATPIELWRGIHILYAMVLDYFPFKYAVSELGEERFSLRPPDFDWQNIFADDEGNITGLIDWDRLDTVPAYMGWFSVPIWLEADWLSQFEWPGPIGAPLTGKMSPPEELERYREDYARYIKEASENHPDSVFTCKSHLFDAVVMALGKSGDMRELMEKILWTVLPRAKADVFFEQLGEHGWVPGQEEHMRRKLKTLFGVQYEHTEAPEDGDCKPEC